MMNICRIRAPTLVLKPKDWYDDYVCHITEDDINMMSVMDWIEWIGLIQLEWIGLDWLDWIGFDLICIGLDCIDSIGLGSIGFD